MTQKVTLSLAMALMLAFAGSAFGQLPAGNWIDDVTLGNAAAGSSTEAGGVYSVSGNGNDIWGTADAGQYLYRELVGDGSMTARVVDDGEGSNSWAKGGIMIRDTTDAGSMHAFMCMTDTDGGGGSFQRRPSTGAASANSDVGSGIEEPYWVRLERIGDDLSGYISEDGVNWTQIGSAVSIPMAESCLIGLAVTSHAAGELRTFTFDNVSVTGGATPFSDPGNASSPAPEDGSSDVLRDGLLTWAPGQYPSTHKLYFGDNLEDVNNATMPDAAGDANSFDPGRLEFGKTYFWRVDEVNSSADRTTYKGNVWSFEVEPYSIQIPGEDIVATASSVSNESSLPENTLNGSGMGEDNVHGIGSEDMWFTMMNDETPWIQFELDGVKKLDTMKVWNSNSSAEGFIGYGVKDVQIEYSTDGENWELLEDNTVLSRAPGFPTYNQYDEIDMGGIAAKIVRLNILSNWGGFMKAYSLSEVQFTMIPAAARTPQPASGSTDTLPNAIVSWRAGREAAQSVVYVGTDPNEVADGIAPSATTNTNSIDLSSFDLEMSATYYWRVDEVNNAEAVSTWAGPVWDFSTVTAVVVEDFESYNNDSPNRPFQAWLDGYGYSADDFFPAGYNGNGTGAGIGHDIWSVASAHYNGDIMETANTKQGSNQSMPFYYNNSGNVASQTERTFATPQDWTVGQAQTLSIAFAGQAGNTGTLYVKINNTKLTYPRAASNIALGAWQAWNIDLTSMNVQNVTKLQIGVNGSNASGMILIDDITLHAEAGEMITPVDPGSNGLVAHYSFEGNANDMSGNGNNGTVNGGVMFAAGQNGQAIDCDGIDGYISTTKTPSDLGLGGNNARTISSWVFTRGFADGGIFDMGDRVATNDFSLRTLESTDNRWRVQYWGGDFDFSFNTKDTWVHFTHVHDGVNTKIYANGMLIVDWEKTIDTTDTYPFQIGRYGFVSPDTFYFDGLIDEVRVYNRALSAEEALSLAGMTAPIDKPF